MGIDSHGELTQAGDIGVLARKGIATKDDSSRHDLSYEISKRWLIREETTYDVGCWLVGWLVRLID
jgi:hypothetical protein